MSIQISDLVNANLCKADREMTTPLILLRAVQLGVQIGEMDLLTIGTINDMYTEMQNDENQGSYSTLASQEDMDRF